ncbi:DNA sulfur modification protein DndB [Bacillus subtilis]|uniref:DNA sulfur modification protein DndB n=1 Tax=Bacillus TaxID=1386 RepID=UPI00119B51C6|nr:DNA sulfur modification protein DndB [Bacillus subtilis]MBY0180759.1 DGQHR domain-containing protein [Bacillus subtilis]MDL2031552.1 DGQHR domain-containing protein [Bacillus subtilis]QWF75153.1 DGQHR domain-containing protein [Bacillus subtilis]TWG63455.1 DNA sulfur modification protein DndB [Bacillus subtilis J24]TWG72082.1 DNA sulfur modification protein DndB [Bacillus subtilis J26]
MSTVTIFGTIDIINGNKEKGMLSSQMKIRDILELYKIDKNINRDISYGRIPKIVKYLENQDNEMGIFFPAMVFSFRGNPINYYSKDFELELPLEKKLIVIDGQHRIKAMERLLENTDDKNRREKILNSFLTVQIYFGLQIEDEKNLFADINSNVKKVSMSLITKFDTRDVLNVLVTELYEVCDALQTAKIEFNKSRLARPGNDYFSTSSRLKELISIILFGKKNPNQKDTANLTQQYDDIIVFLDKLFTELFRNLPPNPGNVLENILGHYATQHALGYYINDAIIINETKIEWITSWEEDIEALSQISWNVTNSLWKKFLIVTRKNTPYEYSTIEEYQSNQLFDVIKNEINS